jgi:peptidyl-tRNA hydrolase, PTH1 family
MFRRHTRGREQVKDGSQEPVYLLAALGNPGPEYRDHRHNVGFMVGDELRARHGLPELRSRFQGRVAEGRIAGRRPF